MRGFVALFRKEWRDVRALTFACMAIVLAVCPFLRWIVEELSPYAQYEPLWGPRYFETFVPFAVASYAVMVASDLVGREVDTKRMDALVLLPVRVPTLWLVKTTLLVVATLLFAAWTIAVQALFLRWFDGGMFELQFADRVASNLGVAAPIAAAAFATYLVSTLGCRGIGAALLGLIMTGALWFAAHTYFEWVGFGPKDWDPTAGEVMDDNRQNAAAVVAFSGLFLAVALSFCRGRVHLGRRLLTCAGALATVVLVVAIPAGAFAHDLFTVDPRGSTVRLSTVSVSPDGRHVACNFSKQREAYGPIMVSALHVMEVETGDLREIGNDVQVGSYGRAWDDDVHLRAFRRTREGVERFLVDARDGSISARSLWTHVAWEQDWRAEYERTHVKTRWINKASQILDGPEGRVWVHSLLHRETKAAVELRSVLQNQSVKGEFALYAPRRDRLVLRNLATGTDRVIVEDGEGIFGLGDAVQWNGDEGTVIVRIGTHHEAVRVEDGNRVALPDDAQWPSLATSGPRRLVWLRHARSCTLFDIDTGDRLAGFAGGGSWLQPMPDGGFLMHNWSGTLDLIDARLRVLKRLWPQDGK